MESTAGGIDLDKISWSSPDNQVTALDEPKLSSIAEGKKRQEKAKVVTAVWREEFIQFLAALTVLP